jgi:hypothetical protein
LSLPPKRYQPLHGGKKIAGFACGYPVDNRVEANFTGRNRIRAQAVILKSETYHFHRLDLTRQTGFIVTVYDEDGLRLAATMPASTPAEAFREARKNVDNKVEGPHRPR